MSKKFLRVFSLVLSLAVLTVLMSINTYALDFTDYSGEKTVLEEPDDSWTRITVSSTEDFVSLAERCKLDTGSKKLYVELTDNISFAGKTFVQIPYFAGIFNGNGYTVSGVTSQNTTEPVGLFSTIGKGGIVRNLTVTGALQPSENCNYIGSVAGESRGIIYKCSFEGVVTGNNYVGGIVGANSESGRIVNCKVNGAVRGDNMVGGIAGINDGSIINCENSAFINTESVDGGINISNLDLEFTLDLSKLKSQNNASMQDMGGIVGYSDGTVYLCKNKGEVGYNHQGYNVGGIVGRSSGYVYKCENQAYICGRKDIGGIVGQMEPYVQVTETESTFTTLNNQIKEMQDLMERTRDHAYNAGSDASQHIDEILDNLESVQGNASDISDILTDDNGEDTLTDEEKSDKVTQYIKDNVNTNDFDKDNIDKKKEDINKNQDELDESFTKINDELKELNESAKGCSKELDADLDEINAKYSEINDTVAAIKDINFKVQDTSTVDPDLIILGAVKGCINEGTIEGDLNAGGIAGVMGEESSVDPEDEISLSLDSETHKDYEYKAVLTDCVNKGEVKLKRNYAGGIVARAEIGFVRNCENYGQVKTEGNYAGGIAAETQINIDNCYVKATLSAMKHAGGIVGSGVNQSADGEGSLVSNCRALVTINDAVKFYGAIAGSPDGMYVNNMFTSDSLYGLGAYSAGGEAYPVSYDKLVQGDSVPIEFTKLHVRFIAGDSVLESMEVKYGQSVMTSDYPSIPGKSGCFAKWDIEEIKAVTQDVDVTVLYSDYIKSLASEETRMSGRPVFYAEGDFTDDDKIVTYKYDDNSLSVLESGFSLFGKRFYRKDVEEHWRVVVPDDGTDIHTVRYIPTGVSSKQPEIYIKDGESFKAVKLTQLGSYYSFEADTEDIELAVISAMPVYSTFVIAGAIAVAVIVVLVWVISINRRVIKKIKESDDKNKKNNEETDKEDKVKEESLKDESKPEVLKEKNEVEEPHVKASKVKARKKKVRRAVLRVLNLIFIAAVVSLSFYLSENPQIVNEHIAYVIAMRTVESSDLSFDADITLKAGDNELKTHSYVCNIKDSEDVYTRIETEGSVVYRNGSRIYLESGKAFEVTDIIPDYSGLYGMLPGIIDGSNITSERVDGGTRRTFWLVGANAEKMLRDVAGRYNDEIASVDNVQVTVLTGNWKIKTLSIKGSLILENQTRASLECVMTARTDKENYTVPKEITDAKTSIEQVVRITPEILDLLLAFGRFSTMDPAMCDISAVARGGIINLESDLSWFRCKEGENWINCVSKNGVSFYYNNNGSCTAKGVSLTDAQQEAVDVASLIDIAHDLMLNGDAVIIGEKEKTVYRLELGQEEMEKLLLIMAPEMESIERVINSGTVIVALKDKEIVEMSVNVSGNVPFTLISKPFSVSVKAVPVAARSTSDYVIPQEVLDVLTHK